jgi:hypothetical protein
MEPNTEMTALWDAVAPEAFAEVVRVFANAGVGVLITPVRENEWEETDSE